MDIFCFDKSQIERRPELLVGDRKLHSIGLFLMGYNWGHGMTERSVPSLGINEFHATWVRTKLFQDRVGYGYAESILQKCNDDEEKALTMFFALVKQYQKNLIKTRCTEY